MQNLLITGASSGVGLSLALHFSEKYHVIGLARRLDKMKDAFQGKKNITAIEADLSASQNLEKVLKTVSDNHGPISHLINNAGIMVKDSLQDLPLDQFQKSFLVNTFAPFQVTRYFLPSMIKNNFGRIINITSGAPINCFPNFAAYSASKAALNALTETCAKEVSGYNIKVNLMSPGPVRTEMAPDAPMEPEVCHPTVDYLISLDEKGPTGKFFWLGYEIPLHANLDGIDWLKGKPAPGMRKTL